LIWDYESNQVEEGSRILIKHKDVLVFSEPARFEEYPRFGEVAEILKARYGDRLTDLVPTARSESWLYGNAADGEASVDWFRVHCFGANVSKPIRELESDSTFGKLTDAEIIANILAIGESPTEPEPAPETSPRDTG